MTKFETIPASQPYEREPGPLDPGDSTFPASEHHFDVANEKAKAEESETRRQQEYKEWLKDEQAKENLRIIEQTEQDMLWSLDFMNGFKRGVSQMLDSYVSLAEGVTKENINDSLDPQKQLSSTLVELRALKDSITQQKMDGAGSSRDFPLDHIFEQLDTLEYSLSEAPDARFSDSKEVHYWGNTKSTIRRLQDSIETTERTLLSLGFVFKSNGRFVVKRTAPTF